MTDNRTTELRTKLTERGVEWIDESNGFANVTTFIANGVRWTVISKSYLDPEHDWMTMNAERITPEQAIAATLGSNTKPCYATDYTHDHCKYSVNRGWVEDTRFFIPTAKQGGGALTAEQVEIIVNRNCEWYEGGELDAQAIADELNAELGSGTCEWLPVESCHTFAGPGWECSNCGHEVGEYEHDFYNCCPICCAKVVER